MATSGGTTGQAPDFDGDGQPDTDTETDPGSGSGSTRQLEPAQLIPSPGNGPIHALPPPSVGAGVLVSTRYPEEEVRPTNEPGSTPDAFRSREWFPM